MSICSLSVYENGLISVPYIAKNTCDKSVIFPMYELALLADCESYSFEVLSKTNY